MSSSLSTFSGNDLPGISLIDGILYVSPEDWIIRQNVSLKGVTGVVHHVEFYGESRGEIKIIGIVSEPTEESIYKAMGRIHMAKLDLKIDFIFVLCKCDGYESPHLNALKLSKAIIVNRLIVGNETYDPAISKANPKKSPIAGKSASTMRIRRDRMKIMLDVMELLNSQSSRITNVVYKCNLNYKTAIELLNDLIRKNYVELRKETDRENSYALTKTGREALQSARKLYAT